MDVTDILSRLTAMGFEDTADDDKMDAINDTLWDIESRQNWPWALKSVVLPATAGVAAIAVPSDFKQVKWITDTLTGNSIWWERLDTIRNRYGNQLTTQQDPYSFYFVGDDPMWFPIPPDTSASRYILDYYAIQPELTTTSLEADILLPKRHHRMITIGSAAKLYQVEDDPEQAAANKADFEQRLLTAQADQQQKQFVNPDRIFVIDEDDEWSY